VLLVFQPPPASPFALSSTCRSLMPFFLSSSVFSFKYLVFTLVLIVQGLQQETFPSSACYNFFAHTSLNVHHPRAGSFSRILGELCGFLLFPPHSISRWAPLNFFWKYACAFPVFAFPQPFISLLSLNGTGMRRHLVYTDLTSTQIPRPELRGACLFSPPHLPKLSLLVVMPHNSHVPRFPVTDK